MSDDALVAFWHAYLAAARDARPAMLRDMLAARRHVPVGALSVLALRQEGPAIFDDAVAAALRADPANLLALRLRCWGEVQAGDLAAAAASARQGASVGHPRQGEWRLEALRLGIIAPGADPDALRRDLATAAPGMSALAAASLAFQIELAAGAAPDPGAVEAALAGPAAASRAIPAEDELGLPGTLVQYLEVLRRLGRGGHVALVGNGPRMSGSGAGPLIDAAPCVVRVNYPPIRDHAADVGRRTDVMMFADGKRLDLVALIAREPGYALLPALGIRQGPNMPRREAPRPHRPSVPPAMIRAVLDLGYAQPTTGFFALLICALLLDLRVTLRGFDFFRPGAGGHYFGPTALAPMHVAPFEEWFVTRVLPALRPGRVELGDGH